MPDLNWNTSVWDGSYDWEAGGEEWSEIWGGSEAHWFGSLLPRIHRHLPASTVLEIAPGYGRWTQYLIPAADRYIGIDLSQECVDACEATFATAPNARFAQNDGLSLVGVEDGSVDFVFSFDSLVHADLDVMEAYVEEILRVLTPNGVAFVHHSNLQAHDGKIGQPHCRSLEVSADRIAELVERYAGTLLVQEIIDWGGAPALDCLTLFEKSSRTVEAVRIENDAFMTEAVNIRTHQAPWRSASAR